MEITSLNNTSDNVKHGEEMGHLAGLLFNRSSHEWVRGVGLEMVTGLLMVAISEINLPHELKLMLALLGFILFGVAYYLRYESEDTFDTAETMRRQAALSEGLGWPTNSHQFAEWKSRAGLKVLHEFKNTSRPGDYWSTKTPAGPKRLLELTIESGFWTRKLYKKLRRLMWLALFIIFGGAVLMVCLSIIKVMPGAEEAQLISSVFLLLPAVLVFDILEWILRLNRLVDNIKEVEIDMDKVVDLPELNEISAMRLVAEYNAVVSNGFPIHPFLYKIWHEEIGELWDTRAQ